MFYVLPTEHKQKRLGHHYFSDIRQLLFLSPKHKPKLKCSGLSSEACLAFAKSLLLIHTVLIKFFKSNTDPGVL